MNQEGSESGRVNALSAAMADEPALRLAVVYGSAAAGRDGPHSDLDIAVAGDDPMSPDEMDALRLRLEAAGRRPVDLVDLHRVRGVLLAEILVRGRVVLNRHPALLAGFIIRMLDFQETLLPLVRRIRLRRAEALAHGS